MTTVFSLISLLVCIHRASASTSQPNTTNQNAASLSSPSTSFLRSTSSSSTPLLSSSSSSSSPLLTTMLNSTSPTAMISPMMSASTFSNQSVSTSSSSSSSSPLLTTMLNSTSPTPMISPMMSASTFSNHSQSSTQSLTNWSTSIRPSSNPTSLTAIASSSTDSLSYAMTSSVYRENPNSSTSFDMNDIYIVETEEIWLSTLDPDIGITSALQSSPSPLPLPSSSSTSYHGNASLPPFPTPPPPAIPSPPPSSSTGAMSETAERTTPLYPQPSTSSSSYESDLVTTAVIGNNSTSVFASKSTMSSTSHAFNGSTAMSPTQSTLPAPDITSSFFYSNATTIVESYTVLMTYSVDGNMSAPSLQPTMKSTHMFFSSGIHITATPSDYQTPLSTSTIASSSRILLNASRSDVLSAMSSTPIFSTSTVTTVSPSPLTETTPTNATTSEDKTVPGVYYPVRCTMILGGDCLQVLAEEDAFKTNFIESISSLMSLERFRISVNNVNCGSVVVDFTLKDTIEFDFAEDLYGYMDTGNISVPFDNKNLIAETIVFHNGPYAPTTPSGGIGPQPSDTPPVSDGDGGGLTFEQQRRLIYILIGVVLGVVVLLAIVLVVHHVMRKTCSKSTQSFDLQDEPCIKLTDFNMAHTCIPRPRSIYSSIGADGRFFRYDNQEDIGNPPASPTSFMYADSQDIKEHYHEVIDPEVHDPFTSSMQNQQDFGRSGLPEWNLPLIDGAPAVSPDLLTAIESHHSSQPSTSSDTFRPPSTSSSTLNNPPVFSPPAPPPPPPPPLPAPIIQSGTLRSRQSCDASSEMTDSSGDSNTLTKGSSDFGTSLMGIDNPLMTPEEDYDIPGPSTSGRMSKYVVR